MLNFEITSPASLTMSSREIATLVDLRHDNVRRTIETLAERGTIGLPQIEEIPAGAKGGRPGIEYIFIGDQGKRDSIVVVAQLSPEFTARLVDRWQELEARQAKPMLPKTYAEALRLYADEVEARERAELERAEAIRTKAQIGSKREATAMAAASAATRKAEQLLVQLDQAKQYATVKRMETIFKGMAFSWRQLKEATKDLGLKTIDIFDANYGTVKAYPADAWLRAYGIQLTDTGAEIAR